MTQPSTMNIETHLRSAGTAGFTITTTTTPLPKLLSDWDVISLLQAWQAKRGASYADLMRDVERKVLELNGLTPHP